MSGKFSTDEFWPTYRKLRSVRSRIQAKKAQYTNVEVPPELDIGREYNHLITVIQIVRRNPMIVNH